MFTQPGQNVHEYCSSDGYAPLDIVMASTVHKWFLEQSSKFTMVNNIAFGTGCATAKGRKKNLYGKPGKYCYYLACFYSAKPEELLSNRRNHALSCKSPPSSEYSKLCGPDEINHLVGNEKFYNLTAPKPPVTDQWMNDIQSAIKGNSPDLLPVQIWIDSPAAKE